MHCLHAVFVRIRKRELGEKKRGGEGGGGHCCTGHVFQEK